MSLADRDDFVETNEAREKFEGDGSSQQELESIREGDGTEHSSDEEEVQSGANKYDLSTESSHLDTPRRRRCNVRQGFQSLGQEVYYATFAIMTVNAIVQNVPTIPCPFNGIVEVAGPVLINALIRPYDVATNEIRPSDSLSGTTARNKACTAMFVCGGAMFTLSVLSTAGFGAGLWQVHELNGTNSNSSDFSNATLPGNGTLVDQAHVGLRFMLSTDALRVPVFGFFGYVGGRMFTGMWNCLMKKSPLKGQISIDDDEGHNISPHDMYTATQANLHPLQIIGQYVLRDVRAFIAAENIVFYLKSFGQDALAMNAFFYVGMNNLSDFVFELERGCSFIPSPLKWVAEQSPLYKTKHNNDGYMPILSEMAQDGMVIEQPDPDKIKCRDLALGALWTGVKSIMFYGIPFALTELACYLANPVPVCSQEEVQDRAALSQLTYGLTLFGVSAVWNRVAPKLVDACKNKFTSRSTLDDEGEYESRPGSHKHYSVY